MSSRSSEAPPGASLPNPGSGPEAAAAVEGTERAPQGRLWGVPVVALVGVAATALLYLMLLGRERRLIEAEFKLDAAARASLIEREFTTALEALYSLIAFYASSIAVERHEFRAFSSSIFLQKPFIHALEWAPRVVRASRAEHENRARGVGLDGYQITERTEKGQLVPAAERDEYYPVYFVEPVERNDRALGFDLASESVRREALARSLETGGLSATGPIFLVQERGQDPSSLIVGPVYHKDVAPGATQESQALEGYVAAAFRVADVVGHALKDADPIGMEMQLIDRSDPNSEHLLYDSFVSRPDASASAQTEERPESSERFWFSRSIDMAGRRWALRFSPNQEYITSRRTWGPMISLGMGLCLTGLLAGYVWLLSQLAARIRRTVAQRTRELAASNRDLEDFAYIASHDLRAPLRAIANLSEWIEEDLEALLTNTSRRQVQLLRTRVKRMEQLIDDLLTYSRAGRVQVEEEKVDTAKLVENVVFLLNPPEGFTVDIKGTMPVFRTVKAPLEQVLSNLIDNAIKHHDRPDGKLEVAARDTGRFYEFAVADDGPGIDPRFHDRAFKVFQTLQTRDKVEGSGLGLALVKKLVERQGGQVALESKRPRGAVIRFTWPKKRKKELLE